MVALCAAYGISRKNGYKWLGRYREFGPEGLHDLPRAPLNHGRATAQDLVERIVAAKELHPLWGPKKIVARLRRTAPEFMWPSASTVGAILARHGLVRARKRPRLRACGNGPGHSRKNRTRCGLAITRAGSGPATAGVANP
ncbi:helix-turn-helix domain-containing protein [Mesorhizobium sp. M0254]